VYLAIATGYDAATGGTQSLVYTWNFTVAFNPAPFTISGTVTGAPALAAGSQAAVSGTPLEGAVVKFVWSTGTATVETNSNGFYTWTHQFTANDNVTVTVDDPGLPPGAQWSASPSNYVVPVTPLGGTASGKDFLVTYTGMPD